MTVVKAIDKRKWGILSFLVMCSLFINYSCIGLDFFGIRILVAFAQLGGIIIIAVQLDKKVYQHSRKNLWIRILNFLGLKLSKGKAITAKADRIKIVDNDVRIKSVPKMEINAIYEYFERQIENVYQDIEKTKNKLKMADIKQQDQIEKLNKSLQREIENRKMSIIEIMLLVLD